MNLNDLSIAFWRIIVANWSWVEIDNLDGYAQAVEQTRGW